jgi:DNA replication and repair protein RecF
LRDYTEKPSLLDALDEFNLRMAQVGAVLIRFRASFSKRIAAAAAEVYRECSGERETLFVRYETVKTVRDPEAPASVICGELLEHQAAHRRAELEARSCLSGPHKDDLIVEIDAKSAKTYASQGQVRTAALALKLAEWELHFQELGERPVLLLDDVLSELDPYRQEYVLQRITGGQVIITCCAEEQRNCLSGGRMFHVKNGTVAQTDR